MSFLPWRVRSFVSKLLRNIVFQQAMRKFMVDPSASIQVENTVINDLIYGWGNESWSVAHEYLIECIEHALTTNGPILECGSGLSTILVGVIAKARGYKLWALEHTPEWAEKVQKYLDKFQIDSVVLYSKPLRDYDGFSWYEPPLESMPDSFSLVVCDGPPGSTQGGRFGLAPIMREKLKPGCVILLDDAEREQEIVIARRWQYELGGSIEHHGSSKPYIKMKVTGKQDKETKPRKEEYKTFEPLA